MMTPQEVANCTFAKSMMGGYNMASVDDFLDKLTEDYAGLFKENAALKAKLKVTVDKMAEYREEQDAIRTTLLTAQKMASAMMTEAEQKRAMERIQEIQLAAQGSQKEQLLLERALRLYEQTMGSRRERVGGLITFWKNLMDQGDLISRERSFGQVQQALDALEAEYQADPFAGEFWSEEYDWDEEPEEGNGDQPEE